MVASRSRRESEVGNMLVLFSLGQVFNLPIISLVAPPATSIHKHQFIAHQQHLRELFQRARREELLALVALCNRWFAA